MEEQESKASLLTLKQYQEYLSTLRRFLFTDHFRLCLASKVFRCCRPTKQQLLFKRAASRIKRGLEVERVLSRLQKVDLLERILLNDSQKFFLPLLNQNLLTIGDNSSSSSEEEEV